MLTRNPGRAGPVGRAALSRSACVQVSTALALAALLALGGCATTSVDISGQRPASPICQPAGNPVAALVLWGPNWRADQKDATAREQAAEQGLTQFFAKPDCFASTDVRRLPKGALGSLDEAKAAAASTPAGTHHVVYVVVRELGPVVKLLSSAALIEGGTEVVLDIAAYDLADSRQARFTVHWRNGGGGVIRGVASLPQDMQSALAAALGARSD